MARKRKSLLRKTERRHSSRVRTEIQRSRCLRRCEKFALLGCPEMLGLQISRRFRTWNLCLLTRRNQKQTRYRILSLVVIAIIVFFFFFVAICFVISFLQFVKRMTFWHLYSFCVYVSYSSDWNWRHANTVAGCRELPPSHWKVDFSEQHFWKFRLTFAFQLKHSWRLYALCDDGKIMAYDESSKWVNFASVPDSIMWNFAYVNTKVWTFSL